jgi:hypothetical protein
MLQYYLYLQVTGASKYSLDVATAVFRFYQLQPTLARKELIAKALLKALSQMPKQDYRILIHMLPEKLVVSGMLYFAFSYLYHYLWMMFSLFDMQYTQYIVGHACKELIAKALLNALSQMPKQDYRIFIHMLPEKLVVSHKHTYILLIITFAVMLSFDFSINIYSLGWPRWIGCRFDASTVVLK